MSLTTNNEANAVTAVCFVIASKTVRDKRSYSNDAYAKNIF